jgi:hypothetical protein
MICPHCEDNEMNMGYSYQSDQQRLEIELECRSNKCPARFFGILYRSDKPLAPPKEVKKGVKKRKKDVA